MVRLISESQELCNMIIKEVRMQVPLTKTSKIVVPIQLLNNLITFKNKK